MNEIYIKILAERAKQDSTLLDKLPENVITKIGLEVTPAQGFYQPKWDGEKWIEGATAEEIEAISAETVPEKITKLQLKIQLVRMGFDLQIIENAINTLPEPQKTFASLSWTEATNFYRDNDMIASIGQMLNLTSEQIDELFIEAEKIRL